MTRMNILCFFIFLGLAENDDVLHAPVLTLLKKFLSIFWV